MIAAAAAQLRDGETVLVGVGMPGEAATLAQRTRTPDIVLVYESGAVGSRPARPPLSIGDPTLFSGALAALSVGEIFAYAIAGGMIDTAFVGAAEIDRQGRLNSTVVGPYDHPQVRLPGSGGACEIVDAARRVLVMTPLEKRRLPAEVQFVTSAPRAATEVLVVTDRCLLRRPPGGEELVLEELYGDATVAEVRGEVGWDLALAEGLSEEVAADA